MSDQCRNVDKAKEDKTKKRMRDKAIPEQRSLVSSLFYSTQSGDEEDEEAMGVISCLLEADRYGIPPHLAYGCQGELRCPSCPLTLDRVN